MLDLFIPFPERVRWQMLRHAMDCGVDAKTLASRLGKPVRKIRALVMKPDQAVYISDIAEWFWAVDGSMLRFEMVPR